MGIRKIDFLPDDHVEEAREDLARGGLKTAFSLKTPDGWKVVDSPWEPRGEAKRLLDRVPEDASSVLVLGSGSGFVSEELISRNFSAALVITGSRVLAERTAKRLDQAGVDPDSIDLVQLAADTPERAWTEVVEPWLREHPDAAVVHHPREIVVFPALFSGLEVRLELKKSTGLPSRSGHARRILFFGQGGLFEPELKRAFEEAGVEVIFANPVAESLLAAREAIGLIDHHRPDIIFSTNLQGADPRGILPEVCESLGIGWGTWLLDDPRFLVGPAQAMGAGRNRVGFCWDRNGIDGWHELGFPHAEALPLATDPHKFKPRSGDPDLAGRIVFVGSPRFASAEGFFARLDDDPEALPLVELLAPEVRESRRPPTPSRIREAIQMLGLDSHFEPEAERRLAAWVVQQTNLVWRCDALTALAPFKPIVYGNGWSGLLPDSVELRGMVSYDQGLPRLYASDAVHLSLTNLQMRAWPNQRLFDVPAAGGCVITDQLEDLHGLFGEAIRPLVFDDFEQMVELAATLLNDKDARRELSRPLRNIVLGRHTVGHRAQTILDLLG